MYCQNCGDKIEPGEKFCNNCGKPFEQPPLITPNNITNNQTNLSKKIVLNYDKKNLPIHIVCGILSVIFIVLLVSILNGSNDVYISDGDNTPVPNDAPRRTPSKYATVINYERTYSNMTFESEKDANSLIAKDSTSQKIDCPDNEIKIIENRIIKDYQIPAINLCELDIEYAKEIEKMLAKLYQEFPMAIGYLTNITLVNPGQNNFIAFFLVPGFFASSKPNDSMPFVYKTIIGLNSKYYLNTLYIEKAVTSASTAGHFPKNANRVSPLVHEFAHYLSWVVALDDGDLDSVLLTDDSEYEKLYKISIDRSQWKTTLEMLNEAYKNYQSKYKDGKSFDAFRSSISGYAMATDNNGNYLYDETIAEAFHDYYNNGLNAAKASLEIVSVLKERLGVIDAKN